MKKSSFGSWKFFLISKLKSFVKNYFVIGIWLLLSQTILSVSVLLFSITFLRKLIFSRKPHILPRIASQQNPNLNRFVIEDKLQSKNKNPIIRKKNSVYYYPLKIPPPPTLHNPTALVIKINR